MLGDWVIVSGSNARKDREPDYMDVFPSLPLSFLMPSWAFVLYKPARLCSSSGFDAAHEVGYTGQFCILFGQEFARENRSIQE